MHTATSTASPGPRAAYPDHSRTIVAADARTRELAEAMVRLNAEGECTEAALLREGFSRHELAHHAAAARAIANGLFVRRVEFRPPSDDALLARAVAAAAAPLDAGALARSLYAAGLTHDQLARIWPKLCARLARITATMPIPAAPGGGGRA